MKVIVTGASGVVGRELVAGLSQSGPHEVIAVSRRPLPRLAAGCEQLLISDLSDPAACEQIASRAKDGGTLLHLAALTPGTKHSDADFERVNAAATGHLMRTAAIPRRCIHGWISQTIRNVERPSTTLRSIAVRSRR